MERALHDSEELARLAMQAGRMFAFEWNPATDEVRRSKDCADVIGLTGDATREIGKDSLQRVHPDDRERLTQTVKSLTPANATYETEYRVVHPGDQVLTFRQNARAFFDSDGRMIRLIGMTADITEHKRAEAALRESDLLYKEVFDQTSYCVFLLDVTPDGRFKFAGFNPAEENAVGFSSAEVSGKFVEDVFGPEVAKGVIANYRRCLQVGTVINYEEELNLPVGSRHFHTNLIPVRDAAGQIHRIVGVARDITNRKRAEAALRESDQRFRAIFTQAAVGLAQTDLDGKYLLLNDRFCEIAGYTQAELQGKTFLDITHPDDREASVVKVRRLLAGEISSNKMEKRYIRKDGSIVWVTLSTSLVRDQENQPQYFTSVAEDITDRVRAERALRESEGRLALAQNAARLGIWDSDLTRRGTTTFSGEYATLYGLAPDHPPLTRNEWLGLIHPDDRERVRGLVRECIKRTHVWDSEFRVLWPDGSVHWLLGKGTVFLDDSGKPVRMAGVSFDITGRKEIESALLESEARFRNMADTAPVMIWVVGPDKQAAFFNKGWLAFRGRTLEQELGGGVEEGIHPDDADRCAATYSAAFAARVNLQMEFRLRRADGEYRSVLCNGVPRFAPGGVFAGYIGCVTDVTDLKLAQEEALARQKEKSVGELAGGVAHDFNNLLGSILAVAEAALTDMAAGMPGFAEIRSIKAVALRASEIVRELMIYSGQENATLEPVDISRLVDEMLQLLRVSISKRAALMTDLGQSLPAIQANAPQIRQVVMNLITNASQAIGERDGMIHVTTERVTLPEGDHVRLAVADTGCGMTEETQARVYDPFFTTKVAGRGLGLAAVRGIVRAHGGAIKLTSQPGKGTTFEILLPGSGQPPKQDIMSQTRSSAEQGSGATRTVLMVEDEEVLRLSVSKMLRKKGFSVIEAGDGYSALDLFRAHKNRIDVILLDMTIPGASSREVIVEAGKIRPDIRIVLTSAYSRSMAVSSLDAPQIKGFVRKPFQIDELVQLLRATLST
jgi:PAS domain S-box-containing protein